MRTELHSKLTATLKLMDELIDTVEEADVTYAFPSTLDSIKQQREWFRVDVGQMIDYLFPTEEATLENNPPTTRSSVL